MKKNKILEIFFMFLLFPYSSFALTFSEEPLAIKEPVIVEEPAVCLNEPFLVKTLGGQTVASIVYDNECNRHMIFDPNNPLGEDKVLMSQTKAETMTQLDYLPLAAHWAPVFYQDVDNDEREADYIVAFNYDGDWVGNNNWDNLHNFHNALFGYVYYSVIESDTHWFISYGVFHAKDNGPWPCPWDCHENDFEGAQLVVHKDGTEFGSLMIVSTRFHNELRKWRRHPDVTSGGEGAFPVDGNRPKISIESNGHGVEIDPGVTGGDGFSNGSFPGGDGCVYRYTGVAEIPLHNNDRDVGYALLPLYTELWNRQWPLYPNETYYGIFNYNGARFGIERIRPNFSGNDHQDNDVTPPWAWDEDGDGSVYKGDWFLDPAWSFDQYFTITHTFSLDYVNNAYLGLQSTTISVDANNASDYFQFGAFGNSNIGMNTNCEDNNYNRWCYESGNHWPNNLIGCYEISDDHGSTDCSFTTDHTNYIDYNWNKTNYPIYNIQIEKIKVMTDTNKSICSSVSGFESDDGWEYGTGDILTFNLVYPSWANQYCEDGGSNGPYSIEVYFDAVGLLDKIRVKAGDHNDEGAFKIIGVQVVIKPPCLNADGSTTPVGECNQSRQYCNAESQLINNCQQCGCPSGNYQCNAEGNCDLYCSDGTLAGQCNINQTYCNEGGQLISRCDLCGRGCPTGYQCYQGQCCKKIGGLMQCNVNIGVLQNNAL